MPMSARTAAPTHLLRPETLASLSNLDLVARAVVNGFLTGMHRSPFFGFSQEFAEYRAYAEGDDPRFVDWNVYARTDRTYIKRYIGETNTRLEILLDASASMGFGSGKVTKLAYAKFLAATLAYLAARQHDAVGLIVFDDAIREHRPSSARSGRLSGVLHAIDRAAARHRHGPQDSVRALPRGRERPRPRGRDLGFLLRSRRAAEERAAARVSRPGRGAVPAARSAGAQAGAQGVRAARGHGERRVDGGVADLHELSVSRADRGAHRGAQEIGDARGRRPPARRHHRSRSTKRCAATSSFRRRRG